MFSSRDESECIRFPSNSSSSSTSLATATEKTRTQGSVRRRGGHAPFVGYAIVTVFLPYAVVLTCSSRSFLMHRDWTFCPSPAGRRFALTFLLWPERLLSLSGPPFLLALLGVVFPVLPSVPPATWVLLSGTALSVAGGVRYPTAPKTQSIPRQHLCDRSRGPGSCWR